MKNKYSVSYLDGTDLWMKERGGGMVCHGKKWKNSAIVVGIGDHMHHSRGYVNWPLHTSPIFFTRVTHFLPWIKKVLVIYFKSKYTSNDVSTISTFSTLTFPESINSVGHTTFKSTPTTPSYATPCLPTIPIPPEHKFFCLNLINVNHVHNR